MPEGAQIAHSTLIGEDGIILVDGQTRLSLAGLLWPDTLDKKEQKALQQRLSIALSGQNISWKPAGAPNRWGIIPAYIFAQENDKTLPPFWLQAGMIQAGLTPAWPDLTEKQCWNMLLAHEKRARRAKSGFWAPRAQAARHALIRTNLSRNQGRRMVGRWKVSSVKAGRAIEFINLGKNAYSRTSLWLSQKQTAHFTKAGKPSATWQGAWIIIRFVLNEHGFRRIRIETVEHVDILDEQQTIPPQTAP